MKKKKFSVGLLFVYLVLVIWALTTIYPLIWVVMNSFKDKKQIVSNSFSFPVGALFTLDNYEKAINKFSIFYRLQKQPADFLYGGRSGYPVCRACLLCASPL